jgi:mitochondrial fission protein ELM1
MDQGHKAAECWVVTDGAAGNERQALALAERTGLPVRVFAIPLPWPWSWVAPRLLPGARLALPPSAREAFTPPWPKVAIGCGRASAMVTRLLRELSAGATFVTQILDPRIDPRHWDLVVAPTHDGLHGANVVDLLGSLNPVDDAWLAAGRDACPQLGDLPPPRCAVLLGGERRGVALDDAYADALVAALRAHGGGSVMVTASRRTPAGFRDRVFRALADIPGVRHDGTGPNPYAGYLGWADRVVVTPDSVNMLSEACATGKPVASLVRQALPAKLARFHDALRARGLLGDLDGTWPAGTPPLRETRRVGDILRARWQRR